MALKPNIATVNTTMPNTTNAVYSAVEKLGAQVVKMAKSRNPLNVFDKGYIPNGTIVEELGIKMVASTTTPDKGTGSFTPNPPNLLDYFYQFGNKRRYATTLSDADERAIMTGDVEGLSEKLIGSLTEGEGDEDYQSMLSIFTDSAFTAAHTAEAVTGVDTLLKKIRATAKLFTFSNDAYYPTAAKTAGWKTAVSMDDVYVIIPVNVMEDLGVDKLANVFKMSEAEILGHIVEIDTTDNKVYVVERDAIGSYSRRRDFRMLVDGSNGADEAVLFVDKMYYWSALGKIKAFTYTASPTE